MNGCNVQNDIHMQYECNICCYSCLVKSLLIHHIFSSLWMIEWGWKKDRYKMNVTHMCMRFTLGSSSKHAVDFAVLQLISTIWVWVYVARFTGLNKTWMLFLFIHKVQLYTFAHVHSSSFIEGISSVCHRYEHSLWRCTKWILVFFPKVWHITR